MRPRCLCQLFTSCLQIYVPAHPWMAFGLALIFTGVWLTPTFVAGQAPRQMPREQSGLGQLISSGQPTATAEAPNLGEAASPPQKLSSFPGVHSSPAGMQSPAPMLRPTMPADAWTTPVIRASATQEISTSPQAEERIPLKSAGSDDSLPTNDRSNSTLQMLLSIGSSLLIVIGLFLGLAWFYRKTMTTSLGGGLPKQVVQVLGRTPIATRQQLVLVRFGSKLVLVSLVQGDARTISEITDPLEVDQLAGMCESAQSGSISSSFRSILQQGGAV